MKTVSESEVARLSSHTIIRPGLIVGSLTRPIASRTGPTASTRAAKCWRRHWNDIVQFIDSRDLAEFTIRMAENKETGIYNATGPEKAAHDGRDAVRHQGRDDGGAQFTWCRREFLTAQKITGWRHMTCEVAPRPNNIGFSQRSIARALAKGSRSARGGDGKGHARLEQDASGQ